MPAPRPVALAAEAYIKAIGRARHLIYLEDQYLWSKEVAAVFAAALTRNLDLRLIAVLPPFPDQDGRCADRSHAARDLPHPVQIPRRTRQQRRVSVLASVVVRPQPTTGCSSACITSIVTDRLTGSLARALRGHVAGPGLDWARLDMTVTTAAMATARTTPTSPAPMPSPPLGSGLPSQSATDAPSGRVTV